MINPNDLAVITLTLFGFLCGYTAGLLISRRKYKRVALNVGDEKDE